ncbi:MAG: transcriptional regulator, partial [Chloroflexi bacterium]|nr:transcriptional regulator [Chloroflexota bacterium]
LALYRGDFLPEFRYDDWAADARERLQRLFVSGLFRLARLHLDDTRYAAAAQSAQRILAIDPCDEQAALVQMQALVAQGDPAAARRVYETLAERLQRDLAASPSAKLREYYQELTTD